VLRKSDGKIINRRLTWKFEKKGLYLKNQSGFRKGRGTMDNVIALEHFLSTGFNKIQPQNIRPCKGLPHHLLDTRNTIQAKQKRS
jgi:hypothetical protein